MTLSEIAEQLARDGFAVFACGERSKKPATSNGVHDATNDLTVIRSWWAENPNYNIAIAMGPKSGEFAIDIDPRNGGDVTWQALAEQHGSIVTETVLTGRCDGGVHRHHQMPPGIKLKGLKLGPGVQVIVNGYVMAPGAFTLTPGSPTRSITRLSRIA